MKLLRTAWYWFIRTLVRFGYFVLTGGFSVRGTEHVPRSGAVIVAPNHASYLDPPAVGCALPRRLTYMAKAELFKYWPAAWLIRSLGAFPVRRGSSDLDSIRLALALLSEGRALLVFPEGARNLGEEMLPLNRGVEVLAKKSGALVLPAAIVGTHSKWGKRRKPRLWGRVRVRFGVPFRFEEFPGKEEFAQELERRIVELCHAEGLPIRTSSATLSSKTTAADDGASEPGGWESG